MPYSVFLATPYIVTDDETCISLRFTRNDPDTIKFSDECFYCISQYMYYTNILADVLEDALETTIENITSDACVYYFYRVTHDQVRATLKQIMPVFGYDDVTLTRGETKSSSPVDVNGQ